MGRKQADIDRITRLELDLDAIIKQLGPLNRSNDMEKVDEIIIAIGHIQQENQDLIDANVKQLSELTELRIFMKKVKQWVKELPIEARTYMPELQQ